MYLCLPPIFARKAAAIKPTAAPRETRKFAAFLRNDLKKTRARKKIAQRAPHPTRKLHRLGIELAGTAPARNISPRGCASSERSPFYSNTALGNRDNYNLRVFRRSAKSAVSAFNDPRICIHALRNAARTSLSVLARANCLCAKLVKVIPSRG